MEETLDFVARHGGPLIFALVFLDQLGLPIPTVPVLLALGALAGSGRVDPATGFPAAVAGSLCADFVWFRLGRWKGTPVLGFLCRVALEPDTCVSRTHDLFARHGVKSLLVAKFVPGFDTVAPPLAGLLGVGTLRFLAWSVAGAVLWLAAFGGLGYVFSSRLEDLASRAAEYGNAVVLVVVALVAAYLTWKYAERRQVLRVLRMARIRPDELHEMIVAGDEPAIVDVRTRGALEALPYVIPGALFITLEELDERHVEIPREKDVILYCS